MDLTLPGHTSWPDLAELFQAAHRVWSGAVLESAQGLAAMRLSDAARKLTFAAHVFPLREFVVYDSEAAFSFWDHYGETVEFESSIVLVDVAPTRITLTVDYEGSGSFFAASAMLEAVVRHRNNQEKPLNFWHR